MSTVLLLAVGLLWMPFIRSSPEGILVLSALGRPVWVGQLYDVVSDQFLPGLSLWDSNTLRRETNERPNVKSSVLAGSYSTVRQKLLALDVEAAVAASFYAGKVEVSGSAKFLREDRTSGSQSGFDLLYNVQTIFRSLGASAIRPAGWQHPVVLRRISASHIVTGVELGAAGNFHFYSNDHSIIDMTTVLAAAKLKLSGKAADGWELSANVSVNVNLTNNQRSAQIRCDFDGDFLLPKNPTDLESAVEVYRDLPKLLLKGGVIAKRVWLIPLSRLSSKSDNKFLAKLDDFVVDQMGSSLEAIATHRQRARQIGQLSSVGIFSRLHFDLQQFGSLLDGFKSACQRRLATILPLVRERKADGSVILDVFRGQSVGPFKDKNLADWLDQTVAQAQILQVYLDNSAKTGVTVAAEDGDLQAILNDVRLDSVVVFSLKIFRTQGDEFLNGLRQHLNESGPTEINATDQNIWFRDDLVLNPLLKDLRKFYKCARGSRNLTEVKFALTTEWIRDESGSYGHRMELFKDVQPQLFYPVGPPQKLKVDNTNWPNLHLQWKPPSFGSDLVESYMVECRSGNDQQILLATLTSSVFDYRLNQATLAPQQQHFCHLYATSKEGAGRSDNSNEVRFTWEDKKS